MRPIQPPHFLQLIARFERVLARVLAVLLILVLVAGALQLTLYTLQTLTQQGDWLGGGLLQMLDHLLLLLIGLEVLQNVTAYLRDHAIHTELVLLTAVTAVARKVIVMPPGQVKDPLTLVGIGVVVLCMAAAYLLIRNNGFSLDGAPLPIGDARKDRHDGNTDPAGASQEPRQP